MSVKKMKRLTVYSHLSEADALLRRLMRCKCVEIIESEPDCELAALDCSAELDRLTPSVELTRKALDVLHKYSKRNRSHFEKGVSISTAEFMSTEYERALEVADRAVNAAEELNRGKERRAELLSLINELSPWMRLDISLSGEESNAVAVILGKVPAKAERAGLRETLEEAGGCIEIVSRAGSLTYVCVICAKDNEGSILSLLSQFGFSKADLGGIDQTAAKASESYERELLALEKREQTLLEALRELTDSVYMVEILFDVLESARRIAENRQRMVSDGTVALMDGWIFEKNAATVESVLGELSVAYELRDPLDDEEPPILRRKGIFAANNKNSERDDLLFKPAELSELYSVADLD
jgi:vacuolar-type H+-ATPase subunit I/STV1